MTLCTTELPHSAAAGLLGRVRSRGLRRVKCGRAGAGGVIAAIVAGSTLALAPAAHAEAMTYTVSQTVPFAVAKDNPCTGEAVALSGTYHFQSNYTVTADLTGTRFHSHELRKWTLRGTAVISGAVYQNQEEQTAQEGGTFTLDPLGALAPYRSITETTMLLIRQGETTKQDDFFVRAVAHITYNANGVITAQKATLDVICR